MTILFRNDWMLYPNAIIDTETKNKSFIRQAAVFKQMGIQNAEFILALHNPNLQGIDPFDEGNLTSELKIAIAIECKQNFWYYLREIARDPNGTIEYPLRFRANRGNISTYWLFLNHITNILIQIRQTGKSFGIDTLMGYLMNVRCQKKHINLLTKDDKLRSKNLERVKNIMFTLPEYLRQLSKNDLANTEEIHIKSLENSYLGLLPNASAKLAENVGRGHTSDIWHIDEAVYIKHISIIIGAALPAANAIREISRMRNEPYGTIFTTTVGKKDDRDAKHIYEMLSNSAVWTEKFYDAEDISELESMIRSNSPTGKLRVNSTFSHRQLGYTDEWLKDAIERSEIIEEDIIDREFFNKWQVGNNTEVLPLHLLEAIENSKNLDYYIGITKPYAYLIRWQIPENDIKRVMSQSFYIAGLDTSDASGGDDLGLTICDIEDGSTIASGNYNETNLITFAEWLCYLLVEFENMVLIIERRSSAAAIIDYLLLMLPAKGIDPFKRLFNQVVQLSDELKERYKEINRPMGHRSSDVYTRYKKYFGFATSGSGATSRNELYGSVFVSMVKICNSVIRDPILINQILSLENTKGRIDHPEGEHDDLVIARLLIHWLMINGKNLSFYGINPRNLLTKTKNNTEQLSPLENYQVQYVNRLKFEIEELIEKISKEPDDMITHKYISKLKSLYSQLPSDSGAIMSIDELISVLNEQRHNSRRHSGYYN